MYSLVLMTAMTGTPDIPQADGFFRNLFGGGCQSNSCSGCYGNYAPRYSCYGGGCSGSANCSGQSASPANCSGSTSNASNCSGFGSRVRKLFDRGGCCGGGCCGGSGCTGSGYGCSGSAYSCFGGPAVAYTPVFNGGWSCSGGPALQAPPPIFDTFPGNPAMPYPAPPMIPPPNIPFAPPEAAPGFSQNLRPASGTTLTANSNPGARATVIVRLPADAKLFAETKPLALTGAERKFVSPELPLGQEFMYRFRVEYDRDGETVSVTKKVPVRAGSLVNLEFTDLTAKATPEKTAPEKPVPERTAVAAIPTSNPTTPATTSNPVAPTITPAQEATPATDRATITVKLPAGATLYVDDRKSPSTEPLRKFSTPPVPVGKEFAYLLRAEIVRNGQTETFTQKVPFRAGERVEVDFTGSDR